MPQACTGFPLPPELIFDIFQWAVCLPGILSIFDSYFPAAECQFIRMSPQAKEARATMLAIVLVCRKWNVIARALVLHHIDISKRAQLEGLLEVLKHASAEDRCRAKRLDIRGKEICFGTPEPLKPLMELIALLPDLEFLSIEERFAVKKQEHESFVAHIVHHLPNLKRFHCRNVSTPGEPIHNATPGYLVLPGLQWFTGVWSASLTTVLEAPPLTSTSITILTLQFLLGGDLPIQGLRFPALRRLGAEGLSGSHTGLLQFLDIHGPQLVSLGLSYNIIDPSQLEQEILVRCTSLRELIRGASAGIMQSTQQTYPAIRSFGTACGVFFTPMLSKGMINKSHLLNRFPKLSVVRVLDVSYESPPTGWSMRMVEDLLHPRGNLTFEDAYGTSIPESRNTGMCLPSAVTESILTHGSH